jgi:hypothetical protein
MSATVRVETDGTITIKVTDAQPTTPDECDVWTVFGVMHAGDPEPLAVVVGGDALAYRNDRFVGGVWERASDGRRSPPGSAARRRASAGEAGRGAVADARSSVSECA